MAKKIVYVLVEEYYEDNILVTDVVSVYDDEKDATRNQGLLQRKLEISEPYHAAKLVIRNLNEKIEVPKFAKLAVSLDPNNMLGKPHICGYSTEPIELKFEPLKDNVFSVYDKGKFVLTIEAGDKPVDAIIDEAYNIVEAHKDVCPKWVLESEDGHDARYPQGQF